MKPEGLVGETIKQKGLLMDSVYRTKAEPQSEENLPDAKPLSTDLATDVEVPYLDREGVPYVAEYFGIREPAIEAYNEEIIEVEGYIEDLISKGEIANNVKAVKHKLKELERINNLKEESREAVKIGIIAAYINFLNDTEETKRNGFKYG